MKGTNLSSLFPDIDIPVMADALFIYLNVHLFFSFNNRKKQNYIGHLHGEELHT